MKDNTNKCKRKAISVAKQLNYGEDVISQLEEADSEFRVTQIMSIARKRSIRKEDEKWR